MEKAEVIKAANIIKSSNLPDGSTYVEVLEFLRMYSGEKSSFYKYVSKLNGSLTWNASVALQTLNSFIRFLENDLTEGMSIERKAQIDVVSDFLDQANQLLSSKGVHPAAACVLVGASLEEFLRTWIEAESISIGNNKPGMDAYSKALKESDLITKQDFKDITSWAGLRNHAAHGEWDEVADKSKISLMLQGVNLFMRKYSS